jgi:NAD(P)H-hydrate epimerase
MVIDADGLNALAEDPKILLKAPAARILTPHPGEMSRLTGKGKSFIENNRTTATKNFAKKYRCILVLKGHRTIVAEPNGKIYINRTGNAGMAKAGSGDVLTGIITALLAQGIEPFTAARWSVFLHGRAGDLAAKTKGKASLIATDLIDYLSQAIRLIR